MKKLFVVIGLLIFCTSVGQGLYYFKDGFSARRIQPLNRMASCILNKEAQAALSQPFHYLGRGRQCFAFGSQDGKYVVKLPRTDIYKTPFWSHVLPVDSYRKKLRAERQAQELFILESFRISLEELQNQTGVLAVHLGQSDPSEKKICLVDALGCSHHLPLDKTSFVLQYKQPILIKTFLTALQQGNRKEAERILDAMFDTVVERGRKGILNRDRSFLRNYGFDGKKAYQIDVGSFFRDETLAGSAAFEKSVRDSMDPVQEWLAKTDPQMLDYLNDKLTRLSL